MMEIFSLGRRCDFTLRFISIVIFLLITRGEETHALSQDKTLAAFSAPFIDVIPLGPIEDEYVTVPMVLDGGQVELRHQLGTDQEMSSLEFARGMGKDLAEVWHIASEVKKASSRHMRDMMIPSDNNKFEVLATKVFKSEVGVYVLTHIRSPMGTNAALKVYSPRQEELVSKESNNERQSVLGLLGVNDKVERCGDGWTLLCSLQGDACEASDATLISAMHLLQQTTGEQAEIIGDTLMDSMGRVEPDFVLDYLIRRAEIFNVNGGVLNMDNPNRDGETVWKKGDGTHPLSKKLLSSIEAGLNFASSIADGALEIQGMSSASIRHFLSALASSYGESEINYLEVGSYKGSTLVSGMAGNELNYGRAVAVDNFEEFDKDGRNFVKLQENLATFISEEGRGKLSFLKQNCWDVAEELRELRGGGFNFYFYDGPHSEEDHFRSIVDFYEHLATVSIFIVDDYNQQRVKDGTKRGLKVLEERGLEVIEQFEIASRWNGDSRGWWDGLGMFVLMKGGGEGREEM